jgi:hypothetical protein
MQTVTTDVLVKVDDTTDACRALLDVLRNDANAARLGREWHA